MKRFIRWILIVMMVFATVGLFAAPQEGIEVRLSVPKPFIHGDVDVIVTVTVTNTSRHPRRQTAASATPAIVQPVNRAHCSWRCRMQGIFREFPPVISVV